MKRKTWALASLALLLAAIAAICLTVIVIDPFQVYRPATRYLPPIDRTTQVYANAGVARSYAYDSAVVGTSVTENFRPSQMDSLLGGRFIKLCTSAGTALLTSRICGSVISNDKSCESMPCARR